MIFHNHVFNLNDLNLVLKNVDWVWSNNLTRLNSDWDFSVVHFSKPVHVYRLDPNSEAFDIIKKAMYELTQLSSIGISYYFWPPGSYIPWHVDKSSLISNASSVYLNEVWDWCDGGLFQYVDGDQVHTLKPLINTGVTQTKNELHCTTIQSPNTQLRKSIQVWYR
jgi:hypothetical protein